MLYIQATYVESRYSFCIWVWIVHSCKMGSRPRGFNKTFCRQSWGNYVIILNTSSLSVMRMMTNTVNTAQLLTDSQTNTPRALKYFYIKHETKGFFRFEIIINVLVSSFRFICLPLLWVYDFVLRLWRLKTIPLPLKGLAHDKTYTVLLLK